MDNCCQVPDAKFASVSCPSCHQNGKRVQLITLKALLTPSALPNLNPALSYAFCSNANCAVVYFSEEQTFDKDNLKVPVFQKEGAMDVPVCYCFGWTRERIVEAIHNNQNPVQYITEQVQAERCGCEVNNPQGSCCLGNVTTFVRSIDV
ncbi:putative iron-sulfur cluster-binding metallochaperone [Alicyclobacillus suci]|uniref:putative iron-sulfur cluster-binding metallochaperone n=1 Tax=Alicyclobacillus suci TaxID=2816080 RepID=UPI001A8F3C0F|nr:(2Fe-2S)-binding protein [Alicyclobacillus suci]